VEEHDVDGKQGANAGKCGELRLAGRRSGTRSGAGSWSRGVGRKQGVRHRLLV
jgi:hypothetical protein